jgi:hypothetical protein
MNDLIRDELDEVLADWDDGRPIRSIALGHSTRTTETGERVPHVFRQKKAHDYCFALITAAIAKEDPAPISWELFTLLTASAPGDLTAEERQAAESLAWTALTRGWKNAIAGFPNDRYITIARPADA